MIDLATILTAVLATVEALDIWFNSSLLAGWRARAETWDGRAGELLRCRTCLGVWVALACVLGLSCGQVLLDHRQHALGYLIQAPVLALACARAAGWLHDLAQAWETPPGSGNGVPDEMKHD